MSKEPKARKPGLCGSCQLNEGVKLVARGSKSLLFQGFIKAHTIRVGSLGEYKYSRK